MCTLHDFSVLKSNLLIRALLLDRILVTVKTTRTPRVHLVIQEIVIIKATRLQAWAPAGGGDARVGRRPLPSSLSKKKSFLAILGAFLLLFLHMGTFLLRFSHFCGPFHHVGAFSLLFTSWWGPFLSMLPGNFEFWTCFVTISPKK